jgi:riboflavin synthase
MFTGIIEHMGVIESLTRGSDGGRIRIKAPGVAGALSVSGSIAVNGCCLTIVESNSEIFAADLSPETLQRTTFGAMKHGARVNLERPLTAGKELGGHFVQGHVDAIGKISGTKRQGENLWLEVLVPAEIGAYIAEKGSLTVDGISLTVAAWRDGIAGFAIIPFTSANTNLGGLAVGDAVNLEADVIAKYVERLLEARGGLANPPSANRAKGEGR